MTKISKNIPDESAEASLRDIENDEEDLEDLMAELASGEDMIEE